MLARIHALQQLREHESARIDAKSKAEDFFFLTERPSLKTVDFRLVRCPRCLPAVRFPLAQGSVHGICHAPQQPVFLAYIPQQS
jgi:hypothetical protein